MAVAEAVSAAVFVIVIIIVIVIWVVVSRAVVPRVVVRRARRRCTRHTAAVDPARAAGVAAPQLLGLQQSDPNFSLVLFDDFLVALYTEIKHGPGPEPARALPAVPLAERDAALGHPGGEITSVIVGSASIEDVRGLDPSIAARLGEGRVRDELRDPRTRRASRRSTRTKSGRSRAPRRQVPHAGQGARHRLSELRRAARR